MGILKRLFGIGKSEINSALDKVEDPIKLLNQKIIDLESMLSKSVKGLAKVKAIEVVQRSKAIDVELKADSYMDKANKLKGMLTKGTIGEEQGKKDILLMLNNYENLTNESKTLFETANKQQLVVDNLSAKIKDLKETISAAKTKLENSKGEIIASKANAEISKEMSELNFDGVNSELNELDKKIASNNAEAEAWTSLEDSTRTDESRIEDLLNTPSETSNDKLLNDFLND